jgi:hypothetical protein
LVTFKGEKNTIISIVVSVLATMTVAVTIVIIRTIRKRREACYHPIPTEDRYTELNPKHVYIKDVIVERSVGKGRFGVVYKGLW